jgi:hypothetical protein
METQYIYCYLGTGLKNLIWINCSVEFDPWSVRVLFVVDKAAREHVFLWVLPFPTDSNIQWR